MSAPASERYLVEVGRLLERLGSQMPQVEQAAGWVASTIEGGGRIYLGGTGHSRLVAEEAFHRAGGLVDVVPVFDPSSSLAHGARRATLIERLEGYGRILIETCGLGATDLLIVVSNSGRNSVPIDMALAGRALGARTIAITSLEHSSAVTSRHPSGRKLHEVVALTLDTRVPHGDAAVEVAGLTELVGPLSSIAGMVLVNALTARAVELLIAAGHAPKVLVSDNAASAT